MGSPVQFDMALVGWSIPAMDAAEKLGKTFVVIGPQGFENLAEKEQIPFIPWDFNHKSDDKLSHLYEQIRTFKVGAAVPLFEETVEWAGYLNSKIHNDPHIYTKSLSLRDKSFMKRKAQLAGLQVGVYEEATEKRELDRFMQRIHYIHSEDEIATTNPIHVKPLDQSGSVGHQILRRREDIDEMASELFPCLVESHIDGQEFSCEVFVHNGKIQFLNITEYVRLGYSGFVPASPSLEQHRPLIREHVQRLIDGFGIHYGVLHPEFFLTDQGALFFGEVAARVPGGHIFELMERVYGFNAFQAQILCSNPNTTEDELRAFFPPDDQPKTLYSGALMLYPKVKYVKGFAIPQEVEEHPFFEKYDVFAPFIGAVPERSGFGNHYATIYFTGDDSEVMKGILQEYEQRDYFLDKPTNSEPIQTPSWSVQRKEVQR